MDNKKVEIKKVEKTFGKRFLIGSVSKNQENENKNELKGVFEKYFIKTYKLYFIFEIKL